ncbi:ferric-dicitrate binding protein FerR (iron transport regulator) [Chitinophaga dinghuensis]|uniref:Ferric-dicitrate binding protein FerR (Iron transport regulator) n=1 Tax=Chitinophaga dinghuensis TaxID=1539050 RepID=A0A327WDB6_9BACT|nr:FecR domain-containing protein [Chitinophaga dinghuensis]RAJ87350.1 ferric-dicitrate binding protein FerR (iron transport regulator) [Chitinophaga dinghuensis]
MYQPTTDTTDLIVRFINAPHDPQLQDQIAELRNKGPEQAAYLENLLKHWLEDDLQPLPVTRRQPNTPRLLKWCLLILLLIAVIIVGYIFFSRQPLVINKNRTGYIDSLLLKDGTKAIMNGNAEIAYPQRFDKGGRKIYMYGGEVFFDIPKVSGEEMQLKIGKEVTLSTEMASFNVRMDGRSVAVYVINGKVKMRSSGYDDLLLTPGLQGSLTEQEGLQQSVMRSDGALAWKTGRLHFNNVPLKEVLEVVRNYYDIQVEVPPSAREALKRSVTANFDAEGAEKVLEVVSKKIGVFITKDKEGRYYLTLK